MREPVPLFAYSGSEYYAASRDGQRFLTLENTESGAAGRIHLALNCIEELNRLVPAGKN